MLFFKKKGKPVEVPKKPAAPKAAEPVNTSRKVEKFNIAGTSFREEDIIKNFAEENDDYKLSAKELKEDFEGERVYKYDFLTAVPELRPEPDNEYDPNAIAVYSDGIQIGYVKKGSTSHLRNILDTRKIISMKLNIAGGDYKAVYDDEISKEKGNIHADLVITHEEK